MYKCIFSVKYYTKYDHYNKSIEKPVLCHITGPQTALCAQYCATQGNMCACAVCELTQMALSLYRLCKVRF